MALDEFRDRIREAARAQAPLVIRGGGTKDFYGGTPAGEVLATRKHAGVVAYEPTELYITARGGTPYEAIADALHPAGQMLAFEPPRFGAAGTIGGMVAAGLSGPRRVRAGPLRDFVLGVEIVDGRGEVLRFGGRVMKNVAGYDVSRLMAGSLGTLGLITEVTLKVLPLPPAELSLRFALPQPAAIARMNEWAARPLPVSATAWHDGELVVRLSGAAAAVAEARAQLGGEPFADVDARAFWDGVRDHEHPFFEAPCANGGDEMSSSMTPPEAPLWRLAVPSTTPPLPLPGRQLLEWDGALRWLVGDAEPASIRAAAQAAGGHATLFRGDAELKRRAGVFQPLPEALRALHARVRQVFDPHGVFASGRLYAGL